MPKAMTKTSAHRVLDKTEYLIFFYFSFRPYVVTPHDSDEGSQHVFMQNKTKIISNYHHTPFYLELCTANLWSCMDKVRFMLWSIRI